MLSEERLKILKMLEEGKIEADEAAQLLEALRGPGTMAGRLPEKRWFRLQVSDIKSGESKLSVNVPLKLVQVGARMGARFVPNIEGIDIDEIMTRINEGASGQILNVVEGGERFEIFVE